ncbi:MAG: LutC/YkgG family protein [Thermodesulfobacteriota bacterium]
MEQSSARQEIIQKLKQAPVEPVGPRPVLPPLAELSMNQEELVKRFTERLVEETGVVYRVKNYTQALERLAEIAQAENLKKVMTSTDEVIRQLDLASWAANRGIKVMTPLDYADRNSFKDAVFLEADAGITGADFAVAESGTLGIIHRKDQARLISLAPILHIAIVPMERLVPTYEMAIDKVFANKNNLPSQFVFITGPSMTGDIQGVLFKGMHGPRKLMVIFIG